MTRFEQIKGMTFDEMKTNFKKWFDTCELCSHFKRDCREIPCPEDYEIIEDWLNVEVDE